MKRKLFYCFLLVTAAGLFCLLLRTFNAKENRTSNGLAIKTNAQPITLKVFFTGSLSGSSIVSGVQEDSVAKEIERLINVRLDFVNGSTTEDLLPMLASGDLPDLISLEDTKILPQVIKNGQALPLDELINTHGKDIMTYSPSKVKYSRIKYSDGSGKLYAVPGTSGPAEKLDVYMWGFNTRWDLYKKLGYPQFNTYMDILPILAKMQELEPVNASGQKVYGISFNTDWDVSTVLNTLHIGVMYGWDLTEHDFHAEIDTTDSYRAKSSFDEDSWMFKGAEFLNKAYQMGLLDPDSINQNYDTLSEKVKAGRVLLCWNYWYAAPFNSAMEAAGMPGKGFMPIYPKDSTVMWKFGPEPLGVASSNWIISSKSKHPEKAMDFLNLINSPDGAMLIFSGVKGLDWEVSNGKPHKLNNSYSKSKEVESGIAKYYNLSGLNIWTIHPLYNVPLGSGGWNGSIPRSSYGKLWDDYDKYYNVEIPYQAYDKQRTLDTVSDRYRPFMGVMPPDIAAVNQKLSNMLKTDLYHMIFAKDDKECQDVKKQIIQKGMALGSQKEFQWILQEREKAKVLYEQFIQK